jgi:hypothetical protein
MDSNKNWMAIITFAAVIAILALVLMNVRQQTPDQNRISVSGSAQLETVPDQVELTFAVVTNNTDPKAAQDRNAQIATKVTDALLAEGLSPQDIETVNYNLYPQQDWIPKEDRYGPQYYRVENTIKVTTTQTKLAGRLIQVAVDAGANRVDNIAFTLTKEKEKEMRAKALETASKNADSKAEALAKSLGVKKGKVVSVSESNVYVTPYYNTRDMYAGAMMEKSSAIPSIFEEKVTVDAQVSVLYSIG